MKLLYFFTLIVSMGYVYNCSPVHNESITVNSLGGPNGALGDVFKIIAGAPFYSNSNPVEMYTDVVHSVFVDPDEVPGTIVKVEYEFLLTDGCHFESQDTNFATFLCNVVQENDLRAKIYYEETTDPDEYIIPISIRPAGTKGGLDPKELFSIHCKGCHGTLDVTNLKGRTTVENLNAAIDNNTGNMQSLGNDLVAIELEAIAELLK